MINPILNCSICDNLMTGEYIKIGHEFRCIPCQNARDVLLESLKIKAVDQKEEILQLEKEVISMGITVETINDMRISNAGLRKFINDLYEAGCVTFLNEKEQAHWDLRRDNLD